MSYKIQLRHTFYEWPDLKTLMARATPLRSGDQLLGVAADTMQERVAAQMCLSEVPLSRFLEEFLVPPEIDEVTRLILSQHNKAAFAPVKNKSVGELRNFLLAYETDAAVLAKLSRGLTPEMVAAVSKICGNQDLILIASKCRVVTRFRDTLGLGGRISARLQPNHPTDDVRGIAASTLDGLLMGSGDAVIGINPASDSSAAITTLLEMLDELIEGYRIPTQSCVLGHVTTTIDLIERGAPVDLVFQSVAGTEKANDSFGFKLRHLEEGLQAARSLVRGTVGDNVMYFETGQGSCLSAGAHYNVDQQTLEARAYAVAREFEPLLVNTVVGFIGPEYLYDGKQITRAGLEDHFCGKLLGLPMGCDVCYTNHANADQDDMDDLMSLLSMAGLNFLMGIPGADDIMLGYQTTSFHDLQYLRQVTGKRPAPEFETWLQKMGVSDSLGRIASIEKVAERFRENAPSSSREILPYEPLQSELALKQEWAKYTSARLVLPRAGSSVATPERLEFQLAHSAARDAVHWPFDPQSIADSIEKLGLETLVLDSDAPTREAYLQRPDQGRRLSPRSHTILESYALDNQKQSFDLAIVVCDGLSALAVERHCADLLRELKPLLQGRNLKMAPVCVVSNGRVAIEDEIGELLCAQMALVLIGERPGLGMPDSLSGYLVFCPQIGNTDANRNCVSNIRPEGLKPELAAQKLDYLLGEAFLRKLSGVELKDESTLSLA